MCVGEAEALINHRIHPADDVADVLERDKKFAGMKKSNGKGDVSLSLTLEDYLPASPTSPYDNDAAGFQVATVQLCVLCYCTVQSRLNHVVSCVSLNRGLTVFAQAIAGAALDVYPAAHPVPGLMVANTDTRHYWDLCDAIYRCDVYMLMHYYSSFGERQLKIRCFFDPFALGLLQHTWLGTKPLGSTESTSR